MDGNRARVNGAKAEIRNPKAEGNPKPESRRVPHRWCVAGRNSDFGLRASFGPRISAFGFSRKLVRPQINPHNPPVPSLVNLIIHSSQFPENVQRDLLASLRSRQVNHKFHYDSVKQTQKWLALHQAYSPSRTDADCARTYDRSFAAAARQIKAKRLHVIGLGCGGGQKDARLLKLLQTPGRKVFYTPSDVSTAMVLTARQAALKVISPGNCLPLVCDLATATDLPSALKDLGSPVRNPRSRFTYLSRRSQTKADHVSRLLTFFGMIPNFEPQVILPRLASLLRRGDSLLFSANLAPGPDYAAGVRRILPLYDNEQTRDWLLTFLFDLGVEKRDGRLRFVIEDGPSGLKRIAAYFRFTRRRTLAVDEERFSFQSGESIRLFFSYRHTPALAHDLLAQHGLQVLEKWITKSEEEGIFLCSRKADKAPSGAPWCACERTHIAGWKSPSG